MHNNIYKKLVSFL